MEHTIKISAELVKHIETLNQLRHEQPSAQEQTDWMIQVINEALIVAAVIGEQVNSQILNQP